MDRDNVYKRNQLIEKINYFQLYLKIDDSQIFSNAKKCKKINYW